MWLHRPLGAEAGRDGSCSIPQGHCRRRRCDSVEGAIGPGTVWRSTRKEFQGTLEKATACGLTRSASQQIPLSFKRGPVVAYQGEYDQGGIDAEKPELPELGGSMQGPPLSTLLRLQTLGFPQTSASRRTVVRVTAHLTEAAGWVLTKREPVQLHG